MAFLQTQASGDGVNMADRLPLLKYDARAGRLFTVDRTQDSAGNWTPQQTDITLSQPQFAVDFLSLEVGWAFFTAGAAPMWVVVPFGEAMPARPGSPGKDDTGKALAFKAAFKVKVMGKGIGGIRELGGNAGALIAGLNELHTEYEAAPEAAAGMIPVVKMTNTLPIKSGQSTNYQPILTIQQWVERPERLGAKLVPLPHNAERSAPKAASANHVPPPSQPKVEPEAVKVAETENSMPF